MSPEAAILRANVRKESDSRLQPNQSLTADPNNPFGLDESLPNYQTERDKSTADAFEYKHQPYSGTLDSIRDSVYRGEALDGDDVEELIVSLDRNTGLVREMGPIVRSALGDTSPENMAALKELSDRENKNYGIISEALNEYVGYQVLGENNLGIPIMNTGTEEDPNWEYVDISFLDRLFNVRGEIFGDVVGGVVGSLAGSPLGPFGAGAGFLAGVGYGAYEGAGHDLDRNRALIEGIIDNKTTLANLGLPSHEDHQIEAAAIAIPAGLLGIGAETLIRRGLTDTTIKTPEFVRSGLKHMSAYLTDERAPTSREVLNRHLRIPRSELGKNNELQDKKVKEFFDVLVRGHLQKTAIIDTNNFDSTVVAKPLNWAQRLFPKVIGQPTKINLDNISKDKLAIYYLVATNPRAAPILAQTLTNASPKDTAAFHIILEERSRLLKEYNKTPGEVGPELIRQLDDNAGKVIEAYRTVTKQPSIHIDNTETTFKLSEIVGMSIDDMKYEINSGKLSDRDINWIKQILDNFQERGNNFKFSDLLELRRITNENFGKALKRGNKLDKDRFIKLLKNIDKGIESAVKNYYAPKDANLWLKSFERVNKAYSDMLIFRNSRLFRVINSPAATEEKLRKALTEAARSTQNSPAMATERISEYMDLLQRLNPKQQGKVESAILDVFLGNSEYIDFPSVYNSIQHINFVTAKGRNMKDLLEFMSKHFKADREVSKLDTPFHSSSPRGNIATSGIGKLLQKSVGSIWTKTSRFIPFWKEAEHSALVYNIQKIMTNPLEMNDVESILKLLKIKNEPLIKKNVEQQTREIGRIIKQHVYATKQPFTHILQDTNRDAKSFRYDADGDYGPGFYVKFEEIAGDDIRRRDRLAGTYSIPSNTIGTLEDFAKLYKADITSLKGQRLKDFLTIAANDGGHSFSGIKINDKEAVIFNIVGNQRKNYRGKPLKLQNATGSVPDVPDYTPTPAVNKAETPVAETPQPATAPVAKQPEEIVPEFYAGTAKYDGDDLVFNTVGDKYDSEEVAQRVLKAADPQRKYQVIKKTGDKYEAIPIRDPDAGKVKPEADTPASSNELPVDKSWTKKSIASVAKHRKNGYTFERNADGDVRIYDKKGNLVEFKVKGGGKDSVIKQNTQRSYNVGDKEFKSLSAAVDDVLKKNNRVLYSRSVEPEIDEALERKLFEGIPEGAIQDTISKNFTTNLTKVFKEFNSTTKFSSKAELKRHQLKLLKASFKEFNLNNIDINNSPILSERELKNLAKFINTKRATSLDMPGATAKSVQATRHIELGPGEVKETALAEEFVHTLFDHSDDINQFILDGVRELGYIRGEIDKNFSKRIYPYIIDHMENPIRTPRETIWVEAGAKLITDMMTDSISKSGVEWELLKGNRFKAFIKALKLLFRRVLGLRDKTYDLFNTIDEEAARVLNRARKGGDKSLNSQQSKKRDLFNLRADEPTAKISPDDTSVSILRPVVQKIEEGATQSEVLDELGKVISKAQEDLGSVDTRIKYKNIDVKDFIKRKRDLEDKVEVKWKEENKIHEKLAGKEINQILVKGKYDIASHIFNVSESGLRGLTYASNLIDMLFKLDPRIIKLNKEISNREGYYFDSGYDLRLSANEIFRKEIKKKGLKLPKGLSGVYATFGNVNMIFKSIEGNKQLINIINEYHRTGDKALVPKINEKIINKIDGIADGFADKRDKAVYNYHLKLQNSQLSKQERSALKDIYKDPNKVNYFDTKLSEENVRELEFNKGLAETNINSTIRKINSLKRSIEKENKAELEALGTVRGVIDKFAPDIKIKHILDVARRSSHPHSYRLTKDVLDDIQIFLQDDIRVLKERARFLHNEFFVYRALDNKSIRNKPGNYDTMKRTTRIIFDKYDKEFNMYEGIPIYVQFREKQLFTDPKSSIPNPKLFLEQILNLSSEDISKTYMALNKMRNEVYALTNRIYNTENKHFERLRGDFFSESDLFDKNEKKIFDFLSYHHLHFAKEDIFKLRQNPNRLEEFLSKSKKILSSPSIEKISEIFGGQSKRMRFQEFLPPYSSALKGYKLIDPDSPHLVALFSAPKLPKSEKHIDPPQSFFAIRENTDDDGILWSNIQSDVKIPKDIYSNRDNMLYQTLQEIIRMSGNKKVYFPTGQTNTYQQNNAKSSPIYDKGIPALIKRMGLHLEKRFINSKRKDLKDKVLEVWMVVGQDKLKTRPHELFNLEPAENLGKLNSGKMLSKAMEKAINQRHQNEIRQVLRNELKILDNKQAAVRAYS